MGTLYANGRIADGRSAFEVTAGQWPARPGLRDATLVLTPMPSTRPRRLVGGVVDDRPRELRDLTYAASLGPGEQRPTAPDSLAALVGVPRARILRTLALPRDMTAVADALQWVRSSASRHVVALERAGLVQRRPRGRHVFVALTARGGALFDLYAGR